MVYLSEWWICIIMEVFALSPLDNNYFHDHMGTSVNTYNNIIIIII